MSKLIHFESIDSTNTYAKQHISELEDRTAILADIQTVGKGRLGKQWVSPKGNLYLSLVYKNQTCDITLFPLLCALAVSDAAKKLTGLKTKIKWPNDLILGTKKVCGILCESIISASQIHIICGIGVNVNGIQSDFSESELPYATSLAIETGKQWDIGSFARTISENMNQLLDRYYREGFSGMKSDYEEMLINRGKTVKVIYQKSELTAECLGIADNGNLLCRRADGQLITVNSGEASVRGLYGYV